MRSNFILHNLFIRFAAVALLATSFISIQPPVQAAESEVDAAIGGAVPINFGAVQSSLALYQDIFIPIGLAPGQTLRYTWANLNDPDPQKREFETLSIQVRLLAADGSVIAQKEAETVGVGQFQSFDFNRDQINLPGEAGTGRLQARLEVTVFGRVKYPNLVLKQGISGTFEDGAEIFDTLTGRTTVSSKPKEIVVVGSKIRE